MSSQIPQQTARERNSSETTPVATVSTSPPDRDSVVGSEQKESIAVQSVVEASPQESHGSASSRPQLFPFETDGCSSSVSVVSVRYPSLPQNSPQHPHHSQQQNPSTTQMNSSQTVKGDSSRNNSVQHKNDTASDESHSCPGSFRMDSRIRSTDSDSSAFATTCQLFNKYRYDRRDHSQLQPKLSNLHDDNHNNYIDMGRDDESNHDTPSDDAAQLPHIATALSSDSSLYQIMSQPSRVFLQDAVTDMTWARRIALHYIHRPWYNPRAVERDRLLELAQQASMRGPEARPSMVTREELPSLEKAWAYYEHFALPRYLVEKNQDMHHLTKAEPGHTQRPTRLYDFYYTPLSQMGDFGLGFGLYFSTLCAIALLTFVAGLVNLPNFFYFASQDYSNGQQGVWWHMRGSAICTRTEWVPCVDCIAENFIGNRYYGSLYDAWNGDDDDNANGNDDDGQRQQELVAFAIKNNCDGATMQQGLVSLATLALVVVGVALVGWYQQRMEVAFDEDEQTAQDYSIRIKNPPGDATDPEEWRSYFMDSFAAHATVVTIALDNNDLINALRERRECLRSIELVVEPGTSLHNLGLARLSAQVERNRGPMQRILARFQPGLPELFGRKAELEAKIAGWAQLDYPATDVFVSFETEADQRRVLSYLSIGKLDARRNSIHKIAPKFRFRGNRMLRASEPDEPNTIRWADLNLTLRDRIKTLATTTVCSVLLIFLIAILIRRIHNTSVSYSAAAIAVCNSVFPLVAKELTHMERHSSEGGRQTSLYFKIAVFRWCTSAVIMFVITPFTATLSENDGAIPSIYAIFFAELVTTNLIKIVDPTGNFQRHFVAPRATTQDAMNLAMEGEEVELAERYTNMTKILFLALWYCSIYPGALFMCSFSLMVNYYTDKYSLMRQWRRQGMLSTRIANFSQSYFMPSAVVAMAVLSAYYWAGFPFDNLCRYESDIPAQYIGTHSIESGGQTISLTVAEDDAFYRFCSQDMIRFKPPRFPALSMWQPEGEEWMSQSQETIVNMFGIASVFVIALAVIKFLARAYTWVQWWFQGKYSAVGDDQGINYSDVKCISAYVPQVKSTMYSYPLLAFDMRGLSPKILDWTDPERPHTYYDLTQDADDLIEDLNIGDRLVFSLVSHCPPRKTTTQSWFAR